MIREAYTVDIPAISRLRTASWESAEFWEPRVRAYMMRTHSPRLALPERVIYVADDGKILTGMIAGHLTRRYDCEGEIQWIDVDPGSKRQGIGSALMRRMALWFTEHKALRICVDVRPENSAARAFYMSHGAGALNEHWMVWQDISLLAR